MNKDEDDTGFQHGSETIPSEYSEGDSDNNDKDQENEEYEGGEEEEEEEEEKVFRPPSVTPQKGISRSSFEQEALGAPQPPPPPPKSGFPLPPGVTSLSRGSALLEAMRAEALRLPPVGGSGAAAAPPAHSSSGAEWQSQQQQQPLPPPPPPPPARPISHPVITDIETTQIEQQLQMLLQEQLQQQGKEEDNDEGEERVGTAAVATAQAVKKEPETPQDSVMDTAQPHQRCEGPLAGNADGVHQEGAPGEGGGGDGKSNDGALHYVTDELISKFQQHLCYSFSNNSKRPSGSGESSTLRASNADAMAAVLLAQSVGCLPGLPAQSAVYDRSGCPCREQDGFTPAFHSSVQAFMTDRALQASRAQRHPALAPSGDEDEGGLPLAVGSKRSAATAFASAGSGADAHPWELLSVDYVLLARQEAREAAERAQKRTRVEEGEGSPEEDPVAQLLRRAVAAKQAAVEARAEEQALRLRRVRAKEEGYKTLAQRMRGGTIEAFAAQRKAAQASMAQEVAHLEATARQWRADHESVLRSALEAPKRKEGKTKRKRKREESAVEEDATLAA